MFSCVSSKVIVRHGVMLSYHAAMLSCHVVSNTIDSPNEIIPKKTSIVFLQNDELSANIPALSYLFVRLELK